MGFSDIYRSVLKEYPDVMTVEEMSRALGICSKNGYRLLRAGKIAHLRVGRSYRVPKAHVLDYMCVLERSTEDEAKRLA